MTSWSHVTIPARASLFGVRGRARAPCLRGHPAARLLHRHRQLVAARAAPGYAPTSASTVRESLSERERARQPSVFSRMTRITSSRSRSRSRPINRRRRNSSASSSSSSAARGSSSSSYGSASPDDASSSASEEEKKAGRHRWRDAGKRSYNSLAGTRRRQSRYVDPRHGRIMFDDDDDDDDGDSDDSDIGDRRRRGGKNKRGRRGNETAPQYSDSESDSTYNSRPLYRSDAEAGTSTRSSSSDGPSSSSDRKRRPSLLVLILGLLIALVLLLLAFVALKKYFFSTSSSSASSPSGSGEPSSVVVTETVTLSGGGIATITVTESGGSAPSSPPASSPAGGKPGNGGKKKEGALILPGASRNNIGIGFLPDYKTQTMAGLTKDLGIKSSFYGWYAQLPKSGAWDGAQLLSQMDDIKACKCIFQPAVMPTNGWAGLTASDDSQAKAIAAVMKKFTDEGIEVWLRFAHEVNWYTTDGTYQGGVEDFKAAWAVVAKAVADNDKVKMFYTPNVAGSLNDYVHWYPDDPATVDYLGIDYYPRSASESFLEHVQPLYDKYCKDGLTLFAMGETGTGWEATIEERIAWLDQLTSAETAKAMPHYVGVAWFNYDKEQEFRLWIEGDDKVKGAMKDWLQTSNIKASGATAGNA